jgi:predicted AlkP superfamily phosphohydrolase/phosphomutase
MKALLTIRLAFLTAISVLAFSGCAERGQRSTESWDSPVFILGFDGLDPHLVARFESEGLLPNFAKLRQHSAAGSVRSTLPFISPPAWTSVSTGTPPKDHGIWSFWIPQGDNPQGRYVDATARLAPAIWQDLAELGRTVGVVNVPISCPPDSVRGFMIAGMPFPRDTPLTWPRELEKEIVARGYEREAFEGPPAPGEEEIWLDRIERIEKARRKIGLDLLFERRPDLSFIVFTATDRVQHHLWKFHDPKHPHYRADASERLKNAVRDVYVWSDDVLGEVVERLPREALLLVVSDHGFGPAYRGITKERASSPTCPRKSGPCR